MLQTVNMYILIQFTQIHQICMYPFKLGKLSEKILKHVVVNVVSIRVLTWQLRTVYTFPAKDRERLNVCTSYASPHYIMGLSLPIL